MQDWKALSEPVRRPAYVCPPALYCDVCMIFKPRMPAFPETGRLVTGTRSSFKFKYKLELLEEGLSSLTP